MYCKRVDFSNGQEKEIYEKHFYKAFGKIADQRLIRSLWVWDDQNEQLRLQIPDDRVAMYTWENEDRQNAFYVGGIYERSHSQFINYGFEAPTGTGKYCEILTLFATDYFDGNLFRLEKLFLKEYCYQEARKNGAVCMLATCAPSVLPLYLKWGWVLLDTKSFDQGLRYFLYFQL